MNANVGVGVMGGAYEDRHAYPDAGRPSPVGRLRDDAAGPSERTFALWVHLALLLGFLVIGPFAAFVSLAMWLSKREESIFIDDHGRETMNFALTGVIVTVVGVVPILGWALAALWYVVGFVNLIRASVAASNGEYFRYPLVIRMLS